MSAKIGKNYDMDKIIVKKWLWLQLQPLWQR